MIFAGIQSQFSSPHMRALSYFSDFTRMISSTKRHDCTRTLWLLLLLLLLTSSTGLRPAAPRAVAERGHEVLGGRRGGRAFGGEKAVGPGLLVHGHSRHAL